MATRCARKSNSLRAAKRWLLEDLDVGEAVAATRRMRPIDTAASAQKLRVLGEVFPTVAMDVRRDVLVAANYREDVAAAMLGDLAQEPTAPRRARDRTELLFVDLHDEDDGASELADEEDWSEVAAAGVSGTSSAGGHEAWVVIQDDWEVVDKDGEKVRTFADVLQSASCPQTPASTSMAMIVTPQHTLLPRMAALERTAVHRTPKKTPREPELPAYELERSVKSFGARKRHFLKHRR